MDRDYLERLVTHEEIKEAVYNCGSSKAPGLHNAFADAVSNGLISGININNSLKAFNLSLLQKWHRRLFTSPNDLWVKVVKAFHGHEGGFDNNGCNFKGTWANIVGSSNFLHSKDDVIITIGWNAIDLENIIRVLHVFYLASGLKINIHKSNIYDIGVNEDEVYNMASKAGCIAGGRLTLIKSVLGSLDIYYLLIFRAPESVLNDLERIRSNFFWGGLNTGSLKAFNLALLQKCCWRLFTSRNGLWVKVVKAFHGHEGGFDNNGCNFKGTWANIVGSSNFLHSKGGFDNNGCNFKGTWANIVGSSNFPHSKDQ
nr:RNA-directed DNA polymerase, eukaryota, reverse transcriptase zinc-binding domain protein [Tanacetum cinerariifolium]